VRKNVLIILNYSMNSTDPIFSHQLEAAQKLSQKFDETVVITSKPYEKNELISIKVFSTGWLEGRNLRNSIFFYFVFFKVLIKNIRRGKIVIFSHMTEVQSALVAPFTQLFRIRHFLWYAHASKSKYLSWCHFWLSGIITSTKGSCPIDSPKVLVVGQAISSKFFNHKELALPPLTKLIHIGRFDPAKNLEAILKVVEKLHEAIPSIVFRQVGDPSNSLYEESAKQLQEKYRGCSWVNFSPNVSRAKIPEILSASGCFIHSFLGSLDKTLLEATAARIPVVTINREYLHIFGSWQESGNDIDLDQEYLSMASLDKAKLLLELERRQQIVKSHHSFNQWSDRVGSILLDREFEGV
jgi:glycosyltransferase involved in cell wall biosynthesis